MDFGDWLKTAWTDLLHWFGVEEQKLASFLYPIFQDAKDAVVSDVLHAVIDSIPAIILALGNGLPAGLVAAEQAILPVLEQKGLQLAQTTINTLANALVAQAQASLLKTV